MTVFQIPFPTNKWSLFKKYSIHGKLDESFVTFTFFINLLYTKYKWSNNNTSRQLQLQVLNLCL